jgi:hypothetical protein
MLLTCLFHFKSTCIVFRDIVWMFLFAVHVGEVHSQILLGFVYLLSAGLSTCLDGMTRASPSPILLLM